MSSLTLANCTTERQSTANTEHPQGPFGIAFALYSTGVPLVKFLAIQRRSLRSPRRRMFFPFCDLVSMMVDNPIAIDDSLRLVLARLEGALGVFFGGAEVDRVFSDAASDQISEKRYVFFDSPKIRVTGYVTCLILELAIEARGSSVLARRSGFRQNSIRPEGSLANPTTVDSHLSPA